MPPLSISRKRRPPLPHWGGSSIEPTTPRMNLSAANSCFYSSIIESPQPPGGVLVQWHSGLDPSKQFMRATGY
ncbi:hypothetical protein CEXT_8471 [Caerostris extrusa]|uniref:Uncharacterized protein n=1 Tax=Caerostris extrusa TaxID=172846 RepID=A0AAV4NCG3_CAEEX|nr:hypothetical protein CEXT_8471 [Caerostris extrusa]